jgi:UDP-glucose 4-epimerase
MINKTKVLITGGFGFVGSSIVNKLLKKNKFKIFVIDNLSRIGSENNYYALKEKVKFFKYDIGYEKKKN